VTRRGTGGADRAQPLRFAAVEEDVIVMRIIGDGSRVQGLERRFDLRSYEMKINHHVSMFPGNTVNAVATS